MNATETRRGGRVTAGEGPDHEHVMALYDAHVRDVYRYVHRLCLNSAVAEDVTQDVFIAALGAESTDVSVSWLIRTARNRLIDIVRRDANYRDKLRVLSGGLTEWEDNSGAVVEHLRIQEALGRIRTEHRIVLMLHYVDGASLSELAADLDRSYKSIEGLMTRARAALRMELEDER